MVYLLNGVQATMHSAAPLMIVNGPYGKHILIPAVLHPERFQIIVAGGTPGPIRAVMHGWNPASRSVSQAYTV